MLTNNKITILGLAAALCLLSMIDTAYGPGVFNDFIASLFIAGISLIITIPVLMLQCILCAAIGVLMVLYKNIIGSIGIMVLLYWMKKKQ